MPKLYAIWRIMQEKLVDNQKKNRPEGRLFLYPSCDGVVGAGNAPLLNQPMRFHSTS